MLEHLNQEALTLIKSDGSRHDFKGCFGSQRIQTENVKLDFEAGDHIERKLPNGKLEHVVIDEPRFTKGFGMIPDMYSFTYSRQGAPPRQPSVAAEWCQQVVDTSRPDACNLQPMPHCNRSSENASSSVLPDSSDGRCQID